MAILVPFVAVLIPILTLPFWLFYFDVTPKAAALLLGAAAAFLLPSNAPALARLWRSQAGRRVIGMLSLLAAAVVCSTAFSVRPALSAAGSNWRGYGSIAQLALFALMLLISAHIAAGTLRLETLLKTVSLSGAAIALYATLQYFGWDPLLPSATYHIGEGEWTIVRPPGTIGHADYLGSYLVFVLFLSITLASRSEARSWKLVAASATVLCAFAIVLSGTRSAIVAAVLGALLLALRFRRNWKVVLASALLGTAAFSAFYLSPAGLKLRGRTRWYIEDPVGGSRLQLWRDTLTLAANRPLTGWGPETFGSSFPRYQSTELSRAFPDFYHESPHNVLLDEFADKGLLGLVAFALWTAAAIRASLRESSPIGIALLAGFAGLQFNAFVLTTSFYFFLTSVLVLTPTPLETAPPDDPQPRHNVWRLALFAIPFALLVAGFGIRLLVADAFLATVRTRLEQGDVLAAAQRYDLVRRWEPRTGASASYYSRTMAALVPRQRQLFASLKSWQEAVQSGIIATTAADDPQNAWYQLASIYGQVDNRKDAERCLRSAIDAAPRWYKPHWVLAQLLEVSGRTADAYAEAKLAASLDGAKHPEVSETLKRLSPRAQ